MFDVLEIRVGLGLTTCGAHSMDGSSTCASQDVDGASICVEALAHAQHLAVAALERPCIAKEAGTKAVLQNCSSSSLLNWSSCTTRSSAASF